MARLAAAAAAAAAAAESAHSETIFRRTRRSQRTTAWPWSPKSAGTSLRLVARLTPSPAGAYAAERRVTLGREARAASETGFGELTENTRPRRAHQASIRLPRLRLRKNSPPLKRTFPLHRRRATRSLPETRRWPSRRSPRRGRSMSKAGPSAPPALSQPSRLLHLHEWMPPLRQRRHLLRQRPKCRDRDAAAGGSARGRPSSENRPIRGQACVSKASSRLKPEWSSARPGSPGGQIIPNIGRSPQRNSSQTQSVYQSRVRAERMEKLHSVACSRRSGKTDGCLHAGQAPKMPVEFAVDRPPRHRPQGRFAAMRASRSP